MMKKLTQLKEITLNAIIWLLFANFCLYFLIPVFRMLTIMTIDLLKGNQQESFLSLWMDAQLMNEIVFIDWAFFILIGLGFVYAILHLISLFRMFIQGFKEAF